MAGRHRFIAFRNFAGRPNAGIGFLRGIGGTYFIVSPDEDLIADRVKADKIISNLALTSRPYVESFAGAHTTVQTDDWPYLYARDRAIPTVHLIVSFTLVVVFMLVYLMFFGRPGRSDLHFSALGAGFLLLEVTVISRFALFWGATWIVSSIVISMILIAILIANGLFLQLNRPIPYPALYAGLAVMLIALYFTPLESNLVVALYLIPFTLIGYIFAQSFNSAQVGSRALAYNLFGALVGGLSESLSFVWGLSSLVLLALGFYLVSFLFAKTTA